MKILDTFTDQLPFAVINVVSNSDPVLAKHDALTVGKAIMDVYINMETLEHFAAITLNARLLGKANFNLKEYFDNADYVLTENQSNQQIPNCIIGYAVDQKA